jgi:accessory gene regulator protein AgrB
MKLTSLCWLKTSQRGLFWSVSLLCSLTSLRYFFFNPFSSVYLLRTDAASLYSATVGVLNFCFLLLFVAKEKAFYAALWYKRREPGDSS